LASATTLMSAVASNKERVIFFVGPESPFRQLICGSHRSGNTPGLTWLSEGVKGRSWWSEVDLALVEADGECTSTLLSSLYEGAISFTGIAAPLESKMNEPLDCFQGHDSASINALVKEKLAEGYPTATDPNGTIVHHPHDELINLVLDGMCTFAKTIEFFLFRRNRQIEDLRRPIEGEYRRIMNYMRGGLKFTGASGHVDFKGNDLPNYLAAFQVSGNSSIRIGLVDIQLTDVEGGQQSDMLSVEVNISYATGLQNTSWAPAPEDVPPPPEEKFPILAVVIPVLVLFFCGIVCYAAYSAKKHSSSNNKNNLRET